MGSDGISLQTLQGGITHSSAKSPNRRCHGEAVNISIQLCKNGREKEEERRFLSPTTSSSVPTHKHVHEGRRHIHAGLVWMSDRCFLPLLLLVLIVADPVFCWCLSKLGLSIPRSWGGKANMFVWKFFGKAKLYLVSGKYDGVQRGTVAYTTPLCVFLCAGFSRPCTRSYMCQAYSPESGQTIGLIISQNKAEGWGSGHGLSKNKE